MRGKALAKTRWGEARRDEARRSETRREMRWGEAVRLRGEKKRRNTRRGSKAKRDKVRQRAECRWSTKVRDEVKEARRGRARCGEVRGEGESRRGKTGQEDRWIHCGLFSRTGNTHGSLSWQRCASVSLSFFLSFFFPFSFRYGTPAWARARARNQRERERARGNDD